ncbi:MAG: 3-methylornithine--L-lysine ligase PylC [bacterium]
MKRVKVGIIGGRLQGVEACYLAKKAGYTAVLLDKDRHCAARLLADEFICGDVRRVKTAAHLRDCDFILPALEDTEVLQWVKKYAALYDIPYVYDARCYAVSSSKLISDRLFLKEGIPAPAYYPLGQFPYIVKPSALSGSQGVKKVYSADELEKLLRNSKTEDCVIQEYLTGPSYSIEVIGDGKRCFPLQVTKIITDAAYDCCRVEAGIELAFRQQMYALAERLGEVLQIKGIFDIETILHAGKMYVLEIDARLPSQTPTAVYHSTGINMLELLYEMVCGRLEKPELSVERPVIYQHIAVNGSELKLQGEHIMGEIGELHYIEGFFGCNEALTSYAPYKRSWAATLIVSDELSFIRAERKMEQVIEQIKESIKEQEDAERDFDYQARNAV